MHVVTMCLGPAFLVSYLQRRCLNIIILKQIVHDGHRGGGVDSVQLFRLVAPFSNCPNVPYTGAGVILWSDYFKYVPWFTECRHFVGFVAPWSSPQFGFRLGHAHIRCCHNAQVPPPPDKNSDSYFWPVDAPGCPS